jgi:hypothetical protein
MTEKPVKRYTVGSSGGTWPITQKSTRASRLGWRPRAVLFIDSFEYNDLTEIERAKDFLVRRPIAGKNHADR